MQVYTEVLPATKSNPHAAIRFAPAEGDAFHPLAGTLTIEDKRSSTDYLVTEFPTGWEGRGFQLDKLDVGTDQEAEGYAVYCGRNGQDRQCECRGFLRHGHCKHVSAIVACISNGWL